MSPRGSLNVRVEKTDLDGVLRLIDAQDIPADDAEIADDHEQGDDFSAHGVVDDSFRFAGGKSSAGEGRQRLKTCRGFGQSGQTQGDRRESDYKYGNAQYYENRQCGAHAAT